MNKKRALLLLVFFIVSCAPLDVETPYLPVTQIPFFASDTPAPFIVPVTETPQIVIPVTETPIIIAPVVTETPTAISPVTKWWEVYFTDPLTINDPAQWQNSIEGRLIEKIDAAQNSIHFASFEFGRGFHRTASVTWHGSGDARASAADVRRGRFAGKIGWPIPRVAR